MACQPIQHARPIRPAATAVTNGNGDMSLTRWINTSPFASTGFETQMDWDIMKDVIRGLYLQENLPLKETIDTMAERHSFFATERMYQRQFVKWNWRKYDSKGLRKSRLDGENIEMSQGKATCRRPLRRQRLAHVGPIDKVAQVQSSLMGKQRHLSMTLAYGSQDSQQSEELFISLRDVINGSAEQDVDWHRTHRFNLLPKSADHLFRQFFVATDLFKAHDYAKGGVIMRQAFRDLERVVNHTAVRIYQSLLLDIPYRLVSEGREKELKAYLLHVSQILRIKKPGQPLTRIAKTMYEISCRGLHGLQHYLAQMYAIVTDIYAQSRGENDFNTIKAFVEAPCLKSEQNEPRCEIAVQRVENLLTDAISHFGHASEEAMEIEFYLLFTVHELDKSSKAFPGLCERFIRHMTAAAHSCLDNWSSRKLQLYAVAHWYLFESASRVGDTEACIECLKESVNATEHAIEKTDSETNRTIFASNMLQDCLILEQFLAQSGRHDEATEVRRSVLSSHLLVRAMENDIVLDEQA